MGCSLNGPDYVAEAGGEDRTCTFAPRGGADSKFDRSHLAEAWRRKVGPARSSVGHVARAKARQFWRNKPNLVDRATNMVELARTRPHSYQTQGDISGHKFADIAPELVELAGENRPALPQNWLTSPLHRRNSLRIG